MLQILAEQILIEHLIVQGNICTQVELVIMCVVVRPVLSYSAVTSLISRANNFRRRARCACVRRPLSASAPITKSAHAPAILIRMPPAFLSHYASLKTFPRKTPNCNQPTYPTFTIQPKRKTSRSLRVNVHAYKRK